MRRVDKEAFAKRLIRRIEALQTNPSKVAEALGIRQQTLDNVVQGNVERPRFINELADALSTTVNWLLFGEGPEEVVAPFSPEEGLSLLKGLRENQRAMAIRFIKTLNEKNSKVTA